jgi:hypothetical protein
VIQDLPCGGVISIEEFGYRRRWFRTVLRRKGTNDEFVLVIRDRVSYSDAKEAAEKYVESNYHIWLLSLHAIRPPMLLPDGDQ